MQANTKYELLENDTKEFFGRKLYRIKALIAIGSLVAAGDVGGYVESEKNLQVYGDAWVCGDAQVYGDARVSGNARVSGDARVSGNAQVSGDARVSGNAQVSGDARVSGNAQVSGDARVSGNAWVYGNAQVSGDAQVSGSAQLVWFSRVGSECGTLTVCSAKAGLFVSRGCFSGTDVEFLDAVNDRHGKDSKIGREYHLLIEVARSRITVNAGSESEIQEAA